MPKKLILLIGSPGSGKSTDSKMLTQKHKDEITSFSVGDIIKNEIAKDSAIGQIMSTYVNSGDLIPGEIIMYEVFDLIKHAPTDIVLIDGLPRGLNQMKFLGDALFYNDDLELVSVIEIKVSEESARKRLLPENASADEEALFKHKLEVYNELIGEIESFYAKDDFLTVIDGEQELEAVVAKIDNFLKTQISLFE